MPELTYEEFQGIIASAKRSVAHLETRDSYGTSTEIPHIARWEAGEPDDLEWLQEWCATVREHVRNGHSVRRAKIVSEPLSQYQRWVYGVFGPMVEAGEDVRWVPRRLVSSIALPGNDCYVVDDELVIFLHYAGSGLNTSLETSTKQDDLDLCRAAFDEVWALGIPHREYKPE
ncbi:DUF6879 family protein [Kribbella sp. NPDC051952]|uniref:DUF6879 family protein n=1 Tax=Kribbella sp. NPDC051952 TaxID=3154851 RepID=UPI00342D1F09